MIGFFAFAALAGGPTLDIVGDCPGEVSVSAAGFTPDGTVAVLVGGGPGGDLLPGGPCAGMPSGLADLGFVTTVPADGRGVIYATPTLAGDVCTGAVQFLDVATCALSDAVVLSALEVEGDMRLSYTLELDWSEDLGLGPDCTIVFDGSGAPWAEDGETVTFVGDWVERSNDCDPAYGELVPSWDGAAYHSFTFGPDEPVLETWVVHRDADEVGIDADPAFWLDELDAPFDPDAGDPMVHAVLVEEVPLDPIFAPDIVAVVLTSTLDVEFGL